MPHLLILGVASWACRSLGLSRSDVAHRGELYDIDESNKQHQMIWRAGAAFRITPKTQAEIKIKISLATMSESLRA